MRTTTIKNIKIGEHFKPVEAVYNFYTRGYCIKERKIRSMDRYYCINVDDNGKIWSFIIFGKNSKVIRWK